MLDTRARELKNGWEFQGVFNLIQSLIKVNVKLKKYIFLKKISKHVELDLTLQKRIS